MKDLILCEEILNFSIVSNSVSDIVQVSLARDKITVVNTLNAHSYIVQKSNNEFKEALNNSTYLIPDGSGLIFASKILNNKRIKKISGYDFFIETLFQLNNTNGKIFLLGSTNEVLSEMKSRMSNEYPNIECEYLSPPFKSAFTEEDEEEFVKRIKIFSPDAIFIGLTAPKQEIVINKIYKNFDAGLISGIGAVFDFYSKKIKRPNKIFLFFHLEWLGRFIKNPVKMFDRVFVSMPLFILEVIKFKIFRDK